MQQQWQINEEKMIRKLAYKNNNRKKNRLDQLHPESEEVCFNKT